MISRGSETLIWAILILHLLGCPARGPDTSQEETIEDPPGLEVFDTLVTRDFFAAALGEEIPLEFHSSGSAETRTYEASYHPTPEDPSHVLACSVVATTAGKLLDPQEYDRRRAEFEERYADRGQEYMEAEFPRVGSRAQREFLGAGPGGSAYGLVFTTSDGRCDVRMTLTQSLPETLEAPKMDLEAVARRLDEAYSTIARHRPPSG